MKLPHTLSELEESGYQPKTVKSELRANLIEKMEKGEQLFPGIIGYDEKGYLFFQFPPHPKTLSKTLKRFEILSHHNIDTSIFLLSEEKERVNFVHEMARRCGGRVFHIQAGELGRCLLMDYIKKKIRWV